MAGGAREKFGLSWLNPNAPSSTESDVRQQSAAQVSRSSQQVDSALVAVGVKVLSRLTMAPNKTAGFGELAAKTGVSINKLIPVVNYLAELNWIEYVDDDKIKLTAEGTAQVS
jgi:DNA-binding IclR family transcriptional regulator